MERRSIVDVAACLQALLGSISSRSCCQPTKKGRRWAAPLSYLPLGGPSIVSNAKQPQSGQSVVCVVRLAPVLLFVVVVVLLAQGWTGSTTTGRGVAAPPITAPATPPTAAPTGPPTTAPVTAPPAAPVSAPWSSAAAIPQADRTIAPAIARTENFIVISRNR